MHALRRLTFAPMFAAAAAFSCAGFALAQTSAPATPTMTPAPSCEKPGDPPSPNPSELGRAAAEMKRNNWSRNMKTYTDCLKTFINDQQAAAAPHVRAANAAVDEFNRAIKIYNDQIEASKQ